MLRNIIYVTHAEKGPSGGAKIIYRHSEIINDMKNFSSEVLLNDKVIGAGDGKSKKSAQQSAAKDALAKLDA